MWELKVHYAQGFNGRFKVACGREFRLANENDIGKEVVDVISTAGQSTKSKATQWRGMVTCQRCQSGKEGGVKRKKC